MIKNYVRLFAHTDVQEAVSYLYLIEDKKTCFEYIKELVIESKDSTTLLGAIEKDGRRRVIIDLCHAYNSLERILGRIFIKI